MARPLDKTDLRILEQLQRDASISGKTLAELCHVSEATCSRRVASLKKRGVIGRQTVILDRKKLGLDLSVYVMIMLKDELTGPQKRFVERMQKIPEVVALSNVSGEYDYLLHYIGTDIESYKDFAETYLIEENHVYKYTSFFELKANKANAPLPLAIAKKN